MEVRPRSQAFAIEAFDAPTGTLKVRLKSPPHGGKANEELLKSLGRIFQARIRLISGKTSRKKRIEVPRGLHEISALLETRR
ncbi:MAG: DUF167 domain-containing protein [Candidatus Diapherotrites archaeon]|nr:DUF167 domain-containing protein [Candidatus Diapherotrites archaeon]